MSKTPIVVALLAFAATAHAQVIVREHDEQAAKEQQRQMLLEQVAGMGLHVSVEARPVTGAPYTADAVSESVQVLADGNRIVRRSVSRVYRDGSGRTRREELKADGQVFSVVISDPASGTSLVFDPAANIALRSGVAMLKSRVGGAGGVSSGSGVSMYFSAEPKPHAELKTTQEAELKAKQHAEQAAAEPGGTKAHVTGEHVTISTVGPVAWVAAGAAGISSTAKKEDLGEQVIEGVPAKGTRTTTVIPAGAVGNELPITVTSEEWLSPDLKVLVMTKHADPRSGETTYRLTGITRGEPDPSLFELPAGVTIK